MPSLRTSDLALAGDIADFDLAEIIQMIGRGRKTGKLVVSGGRNYVTLYFKDGRAVFASPSHQRDYLGNILVRRGVVSHGDVEKALAVQRKLRKRGHNVRIGSILAAKGAISRETLQKYIRLQLEETFAAVMNEKSGRFEFVPEFELDDADILVSIDPEWILLESSRQLDEWRELGKSAPAPDAVFTINPDPVNAVGITLEMDDWRIVSLVNGVRTVEEVINRSGITRVVALRTLARLLEAKILIGDDGRAGPSQWTLVAESYNPPARSDKNILSRILNRIRGL